MIEDIKDMSLEYIDSGCLLSIFIYLESSKRHFFCIDYSHDFYHTNWYSINMYNVGIRDLSPDKLRYRISLFNKNLNTRRDLFDLVGRIKRAYKEKITIT